MVEAGEKRISRDDRPLTFAVAVSIALHLVVLFFGRTSLASPAAAEESHFEEPLEVAFLIEEDLEAFDPSAAMPPPAAAKEMLEPVEDVEAERRPEVEHAREEPVSATIPASSSAPVKREESAGPSMITTARPTVVPLAESERSPVVAGGLPDEVHPRASEIPAASYVPSAGPSAVPRTVVAAPDPRGSAEGLPPTGVVSAPPSVGAERASGAGAAAAWGSDASLRDVYLTYRERIGKILVAAIQRRFRREAVRHDEGTVTFQIEIRSGGLRRMTQIAGESALLERVARQAFEEAVLPTPPAGLPDPLAFRFRSRFALEG